MQQKNALSSSYKVPTWQRAVDVAAFAIPVTCALGSLGYLGCELLLWMSEHISEHINTEIMALEDASYSCREPLSQWCDDFLDGSSSDYW